MPTANYVTVFDVIGRVYVGLRVAKK